MTQNYDTPLCIHCSDPLDDKGADLITGETFCGANPNSDKHEGALTRKQAEAAFELVKRTLAETDSYGASRAILQEPGVQCNGWCITLEETDIEFWPGWVGNKIGEFGWPDGVFAEPVTHCHLGLYVLWSPRIDGDKVTWSKG